MNKKGKITKIISNLYTVESIRGHHTYDCRARGKFRKDELTPLVGDFVVFDDVNKYILEIAPRTNELSRPPIANVDIALVLTSIKEPELSLNLLDKQLLCIENAGIEPIIVLSKMDLITKTQRSDIDEIFDYYRRIGYRVFENTKPNRIRKVIKGKTVVLTGQTGAGKSTLINKLDKSLDIKTSPISKALGRGIHTTRHVELYDIGGALVADTPGFSSLDLKFPKEHLKDLYPEFKNPECKFKDCEHANEIDCEIKKKVKSGKIRKSRYENYLKFRGEMK